MTWRGRWRVRKDDSAYGRLEAVVTLAHDNFYSYTPPGSPFTDGQENIDASVVMQGFDSDDHPTSFQEARGHGACAWDGAEFPGGDGIVYRPSRGEGSVPAGGNDRAATYGLVDLTCAESTSGTLGLGLALAGGTDNAAHAPWAWDDGNDGSALQAGVIVTDPALLVSTYFDNTGELDLTYLRNPFRS
ncbi:hypothetical protein [Streptomyces sp. NPDC058579]|uniref:hypothetical protein n=1 Tax=Streptomyces sp. NPDC058579 TaxID=3346548 RepID=UPI00365EB52F